MTIVCLCVASDCTEFKAVGEQLALSILLCISVWLLKFELNRQDVLFVKILPAAFYLQSAFLFQPHFTFVQVVLKDMLETRLNDPNEFHIRPTHVNRAPNVTPTGNVEGGLTF